MISSLLINETTLSLKKKPKEIFLLFCLSTHNTLYEVMFLKKFNLVLKIYLFLHDLVFLVQIST
jgi:hypothetical protein